MYYYLKTHFKSGDLECSIEYEAYNAPKKILIPSTDQQGQPCILESTPYVHASMLSRTAAGGTSFTPGYGIDEFASKPYEWAPPFDETEDTDMADVSVCYTFQRKEEYTSGPEHITLGIDGIHLEKENPVKPFDILREQTGFTKAKYNLVSVYIVSRPEPEEDPKG